MSNPDNSIIVRPADVKFAEMLPLSSILPINTGLSSATEHTMVSILGAPKMPLTTHDQEVLASELTKRLLIPATDVTPHIRVRGIKPAALSLQNVLGEAFADEPDLKEVLGTAGMLSVRLRKPTDGSVSTQISNHAWGTAIDFRLVGKKCTWEHRPRNTPVHRNLSSFV
jgi:hypothetical protein